MFQWLWQGIIGTVAIVNEQVKYVDKTDTVGVLHFASLKDIFIGFIAVFRYAYKLSFILLVKLQRFNKISQSLYFSIDNAHIMYDAHPDIFITPFDV
jgi:hypothetical protein